MLDRKRRKNSKWKEKSKNCTTCVCFVSSEDTLVVCFVEPSSSNSNMTAMRGELQKIGEKETSKQKTEKAASRPNVHACVVCSLLHALHSGVLPHESGSDSRDNIPCHLCRHGRDDFGLLLVPHRVEELVSRQGFPVILHQHPESPLVVSGNVLDAADQRAGEVLDSRDLEAIRTECKLSQFCVSSSTVCLWSDC